MTRLYTTLVFAGLAAVSCTAARTQRTLPGKGNEPPPAAVRGFWTAHGDPSAWKRVAAATFSYRYRPTGSEPEVFFPWVGFRSSDYRHLWVRAESTGEPRRIDVEDASTSADLSPATLCALRRVRYLFSIALASAQGRWEFRQLLTPPDVDMPSILEVAPLAKSAPLGACRLESDPSTGLLDRVIYFGKEPCARAKETVEVRFSDYAEVQGLRVARLRQTGASSEEVADVRLLGREEAERACPLEAEADSAGQTE